MNKSFRDLRVWQNAMDLAEQVYLLTDRFPQREVYGLSSQMRRAAVSIASNIAEGSARTTRRDFRNFVMIAKGSTCELQTQLILAARLGYATAEQLEKASAMASTVASMLSGLSEFLKRPKATPPERTT